MLKIIVATGNKNKVKEIKDFYTNYEIYALDEIIKPFEIIENGDSFAQNALIKANAVFDKLSNQQKDEFIVLSDDSGICVDILNGEPGIYSARYSGENATDIKNRQKLISKLNELSLNATPAHYTACIAIACKFGSYTTHGWMYGKIINEERGENGFGYDFMFIANGFDKTIGELDEKTKLKISHRSNGLRNADFIIRNLIKYYKV